MPTSPLYSSPPPAYDASYGSSSSGAAGKQSKRAPVNPAPETDAATHSNMFPPGQWRDLWAALLFYLHLAAVVAFAGYSIWYVRRHPLQLPSDPFDEPVNWKSFNYTIPVVAVLSSSLLSAVVGVLVLSLTKKAPESAIKASFFANIFLSFVLFV